MVPVGGAIAGTDFRRAKGKFVGQLTMVEFIARTMRRASEGTICEDRQVRRS